jgi:cytochrome P450
VGLVGDEEQVAAGVTARRELEAWTADRLVERRRLGAADDLLQWLVEPDASGALLDDAYIRTNVNFLSAAGSSTVDYALRNVLWSPLSHPELTAEAHAGDADAIDRVFTAPATSSRGSRRAKGSCASSTGGRRRPRRFRTYGCTSTTSPFRTCASR